MWNYVILCITKRPMFNWILFRKSTVINRCLKFIKVSFRVGTHIFNTRPRKHYILLKNDSTWSYLEIIFQYRLSLYNISFAWKFLKPGQSQITCWKSKWVTNITNLNFWAQCKYENCFLAAVHPACSVITAYLFTQCM